MSFPSKGSSGHAFGRRLFERGSMFLLWMPRFTGHGRLLNRDTIEITLSSGFSAPVEDPPGALLFSIK
jgi:hypothetical protein